MISFTIEDTKKTMAHLLKGDLFDSFEVRGVEVQSFTKFQISGISDKDYLDILEEDKSNASSYLLWKDLKPFVYEVIKGRPQSPKLIKIIFSLPDNKIEEFHPNSSALFMNFQYKDKKVTLSTGSAMKTFSLDKTGDLLWDEHVTLLFKNAGLPILRSE